MPKSLDLEKIIKYQRAFVKAREWETFHTPKNLSMALAGEAAEMTELFQWLTAEESYGIMKDPDLAESVRNEAADILFYLVRLADKLGFDLEEAFWEKTKRNEKKYPVELARGNAKKYTELKKKNRKSK